ncbi:ImmA/IrrE family metallo-endopeptidase [Enterococcus durans]|uniref:ImmA/IrrE family metallo-endopeptidase n=1 Tax=Enterococcus durans TaxID=53345 RepID=UPI003D6A8FF1
MTQKIVIPLHRHLNIFKLSTHTLAFETSLEREADIFSCELLLNDQMLEEEFNYIQGKNLAELASFLNVDYEVVNMKYDLFFQQINVIHHSTQDTDYSLRS